MRIQFRLNAYNKGTQEDKAIDVYLEKINQGMTDRELFTAALLNYAGIPTHEQSIIQKLAGIERKIDEQQAQMYALIIDALQSMDLSQYVRPDGRSAADELGDKVPDGVYQAMLQNTHAQEFDVD